MSRKPRPEAAAAWSSAELQVAAAEIGVNLTATQGEALAAFARLLQQWNRVHNLTAIDDAAEIFSLHLMDSLAILPEIAAICGQPRRFLDVGSGAGLPGVPLAIAWPAVQVTAIDKAAKKIAFVTQVKLELALLNLDCVHARVQSWSAPPFDGIVSRAFSSLTEFVSLTRHLLAPAGRWFAMKGMLPEAELRELRETFPALAIRAVKLRVPRLTAERHLVVMHY